MLVSQVHLYFDKARKKFARLKCLEFDSYTIKRSKSDIQSAPYNAVIAKNAAPGRFLPF